ncbi:LysR family transcriptional regulator [Pseudodesulfovibrio sp.]|uniref:LysR family transcriptional regulator n=1 Tax=unclassified Pseudodesulfovibrio TaxID=2661612 RepID=UPI003AFFFBF3
MLITVGRVYAFRLLKEEIQSTVQAMELYQLRSFTVVAEEGNLTRAADRIHASQPAVSAHIRALEEEFGLPLFVRTPRGMQLTAAGTALKDKAESILSAASDMVDHAKGLLGELSGELTIALNSDPHFLRTAQMTSAMGAAHPKVRLNLIQSASNSILLDVRDRRIDAGFSFLQNTYAEVSSLDLGRLRIHIVAPTDWADRVRGKSLAELTALPWILPIPTCPFMQVINTITENAGHDIKNYIRAGEESILGQLVAAGNGLSVQKAEDAEKLAEQGAAIICRTGPKLSLPLYFVYPKNRGNDPLIRALADAVRQVWGIEN